MTPETFLRMKRIIQKLLEQTETGSIEWKLTDDENSFLHSTSNSSIVVTRSGRTFGPVELTVLNKRGREVETISSRQSVGEENAKRELEDLWELARQSALRVDDELDKVLEELDEA